MTDTPHCYAVRSVNPFLGMTEVVEIPGARALSADGVTWQIQVEAERPEHTWGRDAPGTPTRQFFRFGNWLADSGLSRVPINPILDVGAMLAASERLIAALQDATVQLPFPPADRFEYWLLDADSMPLALLASTVDARYIPDIRSERWVAAPARNAGDHPDVQALFDTLAGDAPRRCWFERRDDGTGEPVGGDCQPLPASAFPALPWRTEWAETEHARLLRDYAHALAPRLLMLEGLGDDLRRELEQTARRQALAMTDLHRLYPHVLQPQLLEAARVEARLRRSS